MQIQSMKCACKDNSCDCCLCQRARTFKPGQLVELYFPDEIMEFTKYNGLKCIVVRPLGTHEDLAGSLDYVVSWCCWWDEKLYRFLRAFKGPDEILDHRLPIFALRAVNEKDR